MNLLNLYANGNLLTLGSRPMTTSGSVNYDTCAFNFNDDWKGFDRTAVFAIGDAVCYAVELDDTGVCKIPKECLLKTGILKIGVVGEDDEGTIISTNIVTQRVVEGANNGEMEFTPVNPETGNNEDGITSDESAVHLLWQDDSFELSPDFILDDYSNVDETDIHSVYNVVFTKLAEEYPSYVTANVEGQDYSGNDIMSFTFTGNDYDRVILITANHFASSYMTVRALGGFFKNLCENYKKNANLNFLHSKVKFVVLPVVCPEALFGKSRHNLNGVATFVNYDHFFDESPIEDKGECSFSEPETIPVISLIDVLSEEKCVLHCDFECGNFSDVGKKVYYKANDITPCNELHDTVSKFDTRYEQTDLYYSTEFIETNAPIATNYSTYLYGINACSVVWSNARFTTSAMNEATLKYIKFMGTLLLDSAKKCISANRPKTGTVTKHIAWRGNTETDYVALTSSCTPMWVSGYKQRLKGNFNVTVNGFIIVDSEYETKVRVKPLLYQKGSPTDDYEQRFATQVFDSEQTMHQGLNTIPFSSTISCKYSNIYGGICRELYTVIAAASGKEVKVIAVSYTVTAIPSDGRNSVEVLSPTGLASDYTDENTMPVFEVKYPEMYYDAI
ncbi:MAG: hypothetical protein IJZ57_11015 [Clostridia bacterium]|nr:hypothetical protein [Clostridia bacterium]